MPAKPSQVGTSLSRHRRESHPPFSLRLSRTLSAQISTAFKLSRGWLAAKGGLQEKVYDVAWSDGRKRGANGKLPPVGNTVDMKTATWTNTIGATELITVWRDPDFDASLKAFYYARVLEIPTLAGPYTTP
jgi:hypothetical protein